MVVMAISQVTKVVTDAETWWMWAEVTTALSLLEGMFMKMGSSHFCSRGAPGYGVYSRQKKARTTYVPLPGKPRPAPPSPRMAGPLNWNSPFR